MKQFSLRFFIVVIIFFVGTFMGITVAEKGIYKVNGVQNDGIQSFQVSKNNNQVEVTVLGKTYKKPIPGQNTQKPKVEEEKPVSPKKQVVIRTNDSSFIGNIGNAIGSTLQSGVEKGFKLIASFID